MAPREREARFFSAPAHAKLHDDKARVGVVPCTFAHPIILKNQNNYLPEPAEGPGVDPRRSISATAPGGSFMIRSCIGAGAVAIVLAGPASAQAPQRVKVGTLTCDISGGIGLIIASQKQVQCLFTPAEPGPREVYVGVIRKLGLDLGATAGRELVWA